MYPRPCPRVYPGDRGERDEPCMYVAPSIHAFRRHLCVHHGERLSFRYLNGRMTETFYRLPVDELRRRRRMLACRQGGRAATKRFWHNQLQEERRPRGAGCLATSHRRDRPSSRGASPRHPSFRDASAGDADDLDYRLPWYRRGTASGIPFFDTAVGLVTVERWSTEQLWQRMFRTLAWLGARERASQRSHGDRSTSHGIVNV